MIIPNVREKAKKSLYDIETSEENGYWQGYLNERDATDVFNFDFAVEIGVKSFFDNIDHLENIEEQAVITPNEINLTLAELFEKRPDLLEELRVGLLDWLERERDELVVSMLDGMDNKEYEEIKEKADKGEYTNILYGDLHWDVDKAYYE